MEREQVDVVSGRSEPCVYLISASALDRLAYRALLRHELACEVAVESDFTPTAVWAALRAKPALALVDSDASSADALDAVQMITRLRPSVRILVIGAAVAPAQLEGWSRCHIHGYVVKQSGPDELRAALDALLAGREYFSEGVRRVIRQTGQPRTGAGAGQLSRREAELLPLLARGLTLQDAASKMAISYKTADGHRTNLLRKLGLHDRVQLARYAIRQRIIEP